MQSFRNTSGQRFVFLDRTRCLEISWRYRRHWVGLCLAVAALADVLQAATFIVNTNGTTDRGMVLSLPGAIAVANSTPGPPHRIEFAIPPFDGTVKAIMPTNRLPPIHVPVVIDGYTQPGSTTNTLANGDNAILMIELNGTNAGAGVPGLVINASGCTIRGLVINSFGGDAISLCLDQSGNITHDNVVEGNFIGVDATGTRAMPNLDGVSLCANGSTNNLIGGTTPGARNLISGNAVHGIVVDSGPNLIAGNFIGTDRSGTSALGNLFGVSVGGAKNNIIGGTTAGARNVISGNVNHGVFMGTFAVSNHVLANFIGTDVTGARVLSNGLHGVVMDTSTDNIIGGTTPGVGNVISGNGLNGVVITANNFPSSLGAGNIVQGNFIGTDASGTAALGNGTHGVRIFTISNLIGGATTGAGNVISANASHGIFIDGSAGPADFNVIQGNLIGTDRTGTNALGNAFHGILVRDAHNTQIGGVRGVAGNLISGNNGFGVRIDGAARTNRVQGNLIGTLANGTSALGNQLDGVTIAGSASVNTVGGTNANRGNVIAFNRGAGVLVGGGTNNAVRGNFITINQGLGIDIFPAGVNTNDLCDIDTGPNRLQNFPVLTALTNRIGSTTISGTLNSASNATFTLEFFADTECDPSGFGEGKTFLGSSTVTTDASCDASFTVTLPTSNLENQFVSATASGPGGSTSEFSQCQAVVIGGPPELSIALSSQDFQVNWPSPFLGWMLQTATNLNPPTGWKAVTNSITDDGNLKAYTAPIAAPGPTRFFRLIYP